MVYFLCKGEYHDWFTGYTCVKGELLTPKERHFKCRYLDDTCFEIVEISRKKTYNNFGVRFPFHDEELKYV